MEKPFLSNERRKAISKELELYLESFDLTKFYELSKKIETMKKSIDLEWYAVPPYDTKKESWQIVNQDGELIAQFETKEDCILAVKLFNEKKENRWENLKKKNMDGIHNVDLMMNQQDG